MSLGAAFDNSAPLVGGGGAWGGSPTPHPPLDPPPRPLKYWAKISPGPSADQKIFFGAVGASMNSAPLRGGGGGGGGRGGGGCPPRPPHPLTPSPPLPMSLQCPQPNGSKVLTEEPAGVVGRRRAPLRKCIRCTFRPLSPTAPPPCAPAGVCARLQRLWAMSPSPRLAPHSRPPSCAGAPSRLALVSRHFLGSWSFCGQRCGERRMNTQALRMAFVPCSACVRGRGGGFVRGPLRGGTCGFGFGASIFPTTFLWAVWGIVGSLCPLSGGGHRVLLCCCWQSIRSARPSICLPFRVISDEEVSFNAWAYQSFTQPIVRKAPGAGGVGVSRVWWPRTKIGGVPRFAPCPKSFA